MFLQTGEPKLAVPHFEQAADKATSASHKKEIQKKLEEARSKVQ